MSETESGTEVHLVDEFSAATTDELAAAGPIRRVTGLVDQRLRFPHRGQLRLSAGALQLGDWRRLVPAEITRVERRYVPSYGRFAAARADGAPLVLDLRTGESIVLLVGFRPVSGLDHNRAALNALRRFVASSH